MRLLYLLYCTTYWLLYYTFARRRSRRSTPMRSRAKSMTITFLRARCVRKCKCVCVCVCVCYFMCVICKERERESVCQKGENVIPHSTPQTHRCSRPQAARRDRLRRWLSSSPSAFSPVCVCLWCLSACVCVYVLVLVSTMIPLLPVRFIRIYYYSPFVYYQVLGCRWIRMF